MLNVSKKLLLTLLVWLGCVGFVSAQQSGLSEYKLGSGDKISIQVFGEDDLSVESLLSDAGTISYPFLGEIPVLNFTVGELQNTIAAGLKDGYLIDPRVSVTITEYRQFYVNGEVENAGGFSFVPGLSVRKAISLAGGFTDRASRTKIYIISDADNSKTPKLTTLDKQVKPGDIITVEQSFF